MASFTVKPNADCASVAKSVANDISNIPACANLATCGKAAIDCSASKPADAKKKKDSADSVADILVEVATSLAACVIFSCCATVVFMIARDWFNASSNSINSLVAFVIPTARPPAKAIPAPFTIPANFLVVPPRLDICLLANSAPLVTIRINISATAIIF